MATTDQLPYYGDLMAQHGHELLEGDKREFARTEVERASCMLCCLEETARDPRIERAWVDVHLQKHIDGKCERANEIKQRSAYTA